MEASYLDLSRVAQGLKKSLPIEYEKYSFKPSSLVD
jgi:hypothetical protein